MKVCLTLVHLDNLVFTPLPQLLLKQALVQGGVSEPDEVTICEFSREWDIQGSFAEILQSGARVFGFSCYVWNFPAVEKMSRALKDFYGDKCTVVWGGPHVSEMPQKFCERFPKSVDLVVNWYGEKTFTEICRMIKGGSTPGEVSATVPGVLSTPSGAGQVRGDYPKLIDIDFPYRKEWLPSTITDNIGERVFLIETYRNCPFRCSYCLWGQADNKIDAISYERCLADIEHCLSLGARHFKFADAGLGLVRNRDKPFFRKLADMRLDKLGVHLRTYFFWQVIDEEWCEIFRDLIGQGVIGQLDVGIQTFNPEVIPHLQRPTDFKKFEKVIGLLQQYRLPYSIDLILGLPGDNLKGFKTSVREVLRHRPARFQSFLCSVLPGTYYDQHREELGIKTIRGSLMDDDEKIIETSTFPLEEVTAALDIEAWLFVCFSLQLCANAVRALSKELKFSSELDLVERLQVWAPANAPALTAMMESYRKNLYDSRQKGRVQLDSVLFERFDEVYTELVQFFQSMKASDLALETLRRDLLTFPKFRATAKKLARFPELEVSEEGTAIKLGDTIFHLHEEPVIGVIGTKYAYWRWVAESKSAEEPRPQVLP